MIRTAELPDLEQIEALYANARLFMHVSGNPHQWVNGYPQREMLVEDIHRHELYVMVDETHIYGVFMLHYGEDPTYQVIENGGWHSQGDYATIHRIAGEIGHKGILHEAVQFASSRYSYLRIDTHADNLKMQGAVRREGFDYCGVIHLENGDPRLAYDRIPSSSSSADSTSTSRKIAVSACLAGIKCRMDGKAKPIPRICQWVESGIAVPICPEVLGGLPTPRVPSERKGNRVITREGKDVTEQFEQGADAALSICLRHGCKAAVLKAKSPSCGYALVYDGSFSRTLVIGNGVFAEKAAKAGLAMYNENNFELLGNQIERDSDA